VTRPGELAYHRGVPPAVADAPLPPLVGGGGLLTGILPELARDPLGLIERGLREGGDVVRYRAVHRTLIQLGAPEGVGHVLQTRAANYRKSATYRDLALVLGRGLLTSEGAFWRRQRRIAQPSFRPAALEAFSPTFARVARDLAAAWRARPAGEPFDVVQDTTHFALRVAGLTLFSADLHAEAAELGRAVTTALTFANARTVAIVKPPVAFPWPGHRRFRRALATVDRAIERLVADRRAAGPEAAPTDLLSRLVFATDPETGEAMSDAQLRDEVVTFFLAGHETTANALAWTCHLLAGHPEVQERLAAEAEAVLGGRTAPGAADVPRLELTRRVAEESLRLFPPAWIMEREPLEDDVIGGYRIPAGTIVMLPTWLVHRRPDLWPDPLRFDPDRFLPERVRERPRWAYFPFGGGQRQCIGAEFALMELQVALATLARAIHLAPAPGPGPEPEAKVTLRPKGLRLVARPR